ncbi:hypothetical protein L7F22_020679 [Adiantum nelumboides]|nr:hypothetical protein [Adiantum nelumboides]
MLTALETELENERNAAAVATSEAMAMISRLQVEKSAMQLEVAQLQRRKEEWRVTIYDSYSSKPLLLLLQFGKEEGCLSWKS